MRQGKRDPAEPGEELFLPMRGYEELHISVRLQKRKVISLHEGLWGAETAASDLDWNGYFSPWGVMRVNDLEAARESLQLFLPMRGYEHAVRQFRQFDALVISPHEGLSQVRQKISVKP